MTVKELSGTAFPSAVFHLGPPVVATSDDGDVADKKTTPTTRADEQPSRLESLWFEQLDARHATIKAAHTRTCKWLLDKKEYIDWRDEDQFSEHHGFLWIKGNPGTGKSTIMKFTFANALAALSDTVVLSFFFNARGEDLEKSVEGMYRSLLYQLLKEIPGLQTVLTSSSDHGDTESWSVESLQEAFRKAIAELGQRPLTCFIDALDECGEDQVRTMVAFFEELGQQAANGRMRLHICFSSRHYPHITIDRSVQITLEAEVGHTKDMERYIDSKLKSRLTGRSQRFEEIKVEILERSSGIFLWVVLVIPLLQKAFDDGHVHALRERLDEIPDGLDELFRDILTRDTESIEDLILCLQWILFAKRPLKREELYYAVLAGIAPTSITEWDPEDTTEEDMGRFLLSSSKGLAEMTKSKKQTVQFIHESVRDFLLTEHGLGLIKADLAHDPLGVSNERLKQCCDTYLSFVASHAQIVAGSKDIAKEDHELTKKHPFLEYAVHSIFHHAEMAASHDISQDTYLANFPLITWIALENRLQIYKKRRHTLKASMLYVLLPYSVINLIRVEIERTQEVNIQGERYNFPIVLASLIGDVRVVGLLLDLGADAKARGKEYKSPLHAALKEGHEQVAEILICHGAEITSDVPKPGQMLQVASYKGRERIVRMLLRSGIDPNTADKRLGLDLATPLILAASEGHGEIVRALLDHHANVDMRAQDRHTALCSASCGGHADIVQMLLDNSADIHVACSTHGNPLQAASVAGHKQIIKILLDTGIDINATSERYGSALQAAASVSCPSIEVTRLLLENGADVNASGGEWGSALQAAASCGDPSIAVTRLLLENGADVKASGGEYGNALQAAVYAFSSECRPDLYVDIIKLLIENGADVNASGGKYCSALQAASRSGYVYLVNLLLIEGADVNASGGEFGSALQAASAMGSVDSVNLLLENGADVNASGGDFGSALQAASSTGRVDIVNLLLAHGADVNASGGYYGSALQAATSWSNDEIAKILRRHGATG